MPYGGSEVKGVAYDFDRGVMRGEDGVERPIALAPRMTPAPRPQPSPPVAPPAQYYPSPASEGSDACTCEGEQRKFVHHRARVVGHITTCDKILTPCVFDVQQNPDIEEHKVNPFVFFLWDGSRVVKPWKFAIQRGNGALQTGFPNVAGMLQLDAPGGQYMTEETGVHPGEKVKFGYILHEGDQPTFVGEATFPATGKGLWLPYDTTKNRGR